MFSFYKFPMRPWGDTLGSSSFMQEALMVSFFANLLESLWNIVALEGALSVDSAGLFGAEVAPLSPPESLSLVVWSLGRSVQ